MDGHAMDAEQKMKAVLAEFPVVVVQPVQWGEQDPLGHVNHVTYFPAGMSWPGSSIF